MDFGLENSKPQPAGEGFVAAAQPGLVKQIMTEAN